MKSKKLIDAIGLIGDDLIENADRPRLKRKITRKKWFIPAAAAVLALVITASVLFAPQKAPLTITAHAIAEAVYPKMAQYPAEEYEFGTNDDEWEEKLEKWSDDRRERRQQFDNDIDISPFLKKSIPQFLSGAEDQNIVYSPLNVYMALGMLAELTADSSQKQILDLLGSDNIEELREQANTLWNANYSDDGIYTSILASSLWLNEDVNFKKNALNILAENYYSSSYQGKMGSDEFNRLLQDWLNEQTGGLLKDQIGDIKMPAETVLALATTIYFNAKWDNEFSENRTQKDIFYAKSGNITCDFMKHSLAQEFYIGEGFTAAQQEFKEGGGMWLILPNEGTDAQELLNNPQAIDFISSNGKKGAQSKEAIINLSVPKFDVSSQIKLTEGLKNLGVTDVFDFKTSDFSPMTEDTDVAVSEALHGARVQVDEEGCTAAAYTFITTEGTGALWTDEEVDFVLNRPFVFAITSPDGLPLFVGIVNMPL